MLDEVIAELDRGATSGMIQSRLPAWSNATRRLRNVGDRLGIELIKGVTFGALSEAEMNLAMETALPIGLDEPELRQWVLDKRAAQDKLADELSSVVSYMQQGGTPGQWVLEQELKKGSAQSGGAQRIKFNDRGEIAQ